MIACGVMSGTSLDGIDVAFVSIEPAVTGYALRTIAFETGAFDEDLRARIVAALPPHEPSPRTVARLDADLGAAIGAAVAALVRRTSVTPAYVASHGLTLYHDGDASLTVQIGDPYRIRDAARASVIHDFRRADCALGGSGAPLVPAVDARLFRDVAPVVALNLGGIANLTLVDGTNEPRAWDTGPGNMLLDGFVAARTEGRERLDRDGAHAARGRIDDAVLTMLAADPYFAKAPPKSTGRERFGDAFLRAHAARLAALTLEDGAATLTALTALTVAREIVRSAPPGATVVASGGGARNRALLAQLSARLPGFTVTTSDAYGIDPDAKEAIAFAVLGYETLRGRPAALPGVTGASAAALLGAVVPYDLAALLGRVRAETEHAPPAASKTAE